MGDSMASALLGRLLLRGPGGHEELLDLRPVRATRGVLSQVLAELVLEVLAREGREDPLDGGEVLVDDDRDDLLTQRVGGGQLGVGLVGRDDAELLSGELGALGVGEQPGEEGPALLRRLANVRST